jgi:hypothetical protein
MIRLSSKWMVGTVLILPIVFVALAAPAAAGGQAPSQDKVAPAKHLVGEAEMRSSAAAAVSVREARLGKIASLLNTDDARAQLARWGVKPEGALAAVSRLDDSELASLAARAEGVMAGMEGEGNRLWLWAGVGAAVVLGICIYLLATTKY